jgi:hypothetical protein
VGGFIVVASIDTTNDPEDDPHSDNKLDELEYPSIDEGVVTPVYAVKKTTKEPKKTKHQGRHSNVVENGCTGVQTYICGLAYGRELHAGSNDSSQAENDHEQKSRRAAETMSDCKDDGDNETREIDDNLAD